MGACLRIIALACFGAGLALGGAGRSMAQATPKPAKPTPPGQVAAAPPGVSAAQVERGRYLALVGDCTSCHTEEGGEPYAGGRSIATGFGTVFGPNITPDHETGIGTWTKDDFYRALHTGHDNEGRNLYPAFPYPWFTKVVRADVDALKDYLDTLEPVHKKDKPPQMDWWISWRPEVLGWNLLYFHAGEFRSDASKSAQWNLGAYIVEGLGHCGACHTEKNFFGATDSGDTLAGGYTKGAYEEGWFAPSLLGNPRSGLGQWSPDEIVKYLKTGANARTAAAGPMAEVVRNSTRHLSDADLAAVAVYLKSLPARHEEPKPQGLSRQAIERGEGLFTDNCAACHMHDGNGIRDFIPALAGSSAIQARQPSTVVRVVLQGAQVPAKPGQHGYIAMPAFGRKLDDGEVGAVVTYIRNAWGNRGSPVDAGDVVKERKALASGSS